MHNCQKGIFFCSCHSYYAPILVVPLKDCAFCFCHQKSVLHLAFATTVILRQLADTVVMFESHFLSYFIRKTKMPLLRHGPYLPILPLFYSFSPSLSPWSSNLCWSAKHMCSCPCDACAMRMQQRPIGDAHNQQWRLDGRLQPRRCKRHTAIAREACCGCCVAWRGGGPSMPHPSRGDDGDVTGYSAATLLAAGTTIGVIKNPR